MPIDLPKTAIAIIKSGGTYPVIPNSLLDTWCRMDYLVPVEQGWARHMARRGDLISNISFPANDISDTDVNLIVGELNNNYYKMFNTEIVTSFSALWSSNAQKKVIVFLCDRSFFTHSLEYNSLLTNFLWPARSAEDQVKDGNGNEAISNSGALGVILSEPGDDAVNGADVVLAFTNNLVWSQRVWLPNPDSTQSNPLTDISYQIISYNGNYHWTGIARTIAHEVGHSLGLKHHGLGNKADIENYQEHYFGNSVWVPIMGGEAGGPRIYQWNDGSYNGASNPGQKDLEIISKNAGLLKLKDPSILGTKGQQSKSTPDYQENNNEIISRRAKLVSTLDIKEIQSVKTIEGMIGYPLDTDVLKIVLKAGDYEIGDFRHDDPSILMMHLGFKILKSKIEVSKQSDEQNKRRIPQESLPENYYCEDAFLPEKYPSDSKEEPVALSFPEEYHISREPLAQNDSSVYTCSQPNQFDTKRAININLPKTCLIYLRAYGDEMTQINTTGFPRYGSLGTYRITIRKDGNNFNLNQILPQQTPPNCYATPKLSRLRNGSAEDKIFFTQDPSDFSKNPSYDETSDHPNSKKFKIVANGKIFEIPMLLQGKMYGTSETIDDESKKEFYFVKSTTTPFENKKQEFIMAPLWDYA